MIQTSDAVEVNESVDYFLTNKTYVEYQRSAKEFIQDKIDLTAFLVWFIENYPRSVQVMKESPDYQYKFK